VRLGRGMARSINKLSARRVEAVKAPGRYSDGGTLYMSISHSGGTRWVFMHHFVGNQREMGLRPASRAGRSLTGARDRAAEARTGLAAGHDPLEVRKPTRQAERIAKAVWVRQGAPEVIALDQPG